MLANREQRARISEIEDEIEQEIAADQEAFESRPAATEYGGLHQGIDDVASNVTYVRDEMKIVGDRPGVDGRISLQEYEAISMGSTRRSQAEQRLLTVRGGKNENFMSVEEGLGDA